jgi:hypothetical protein
VSWEFQPILPVAVLLAAVTDTVTPAAGIATATANNPSIRLDIQGTSGIATATAPTPVALIKAPVLV